MVDLHCRHCGRSFATWCWQHSRLHAAACRGWQLRWMPGRKHCRLLTRRACRGSGTLQLTREVESTASVGSQCSTLRCRGYAPGT